MKNPVVHFEIPADDVQRAIDFYEGIFDWTIKRWDNPDGDAYYMVYTAETDEDNMITQKGAINGGLMERKDPRQPFTNYISVESIEETLPVIEGKGGMIVMPKTEIAPGMGWIAAFKDTEGNIMGLHEMGKNT